MIFHFPSWWQTLDAPEHNSEHEHQSQINCSLLGAVCASNKKMLVFDLLSLVLITRNAVMNVDDAPDHATDLTYTQPNTHTTHKHSLTRTRRTWRARLLVRSAWLRRQSWPRHWRKNRRRTRTWTASECVAVHVWCRVESVMSNRWVAACEVCVAQETEGM